MISSYLFMGLVMKLQYQKEKIADFSKVVFSQDFQQYYGMTNTYKNFEEQNLSNEIKEFLKELIYD